MIQEYYVLRSKEVPKYQRPVDGTYKTICYITLENGRRKRPIKVAEVISTSGFINKFYRDGRRACEQAINNFLPIKATEHANVSYRFTVSIAILEHAYGHEIARTLFDRDEIMQFFNKVDQTDRFSLGVPVAALFEAVVRAKQNVRDMNDLGSIVQRVTQDVAHTLDEKLTEAMNQALGI